MNSLHRKTRQLCAAIERTLQSSLACDVEDPVLDDVTLDHVEAVDGAFVAVFMTSTLSVAALADLQTHLDACAPTFREAMARELSRKRVPTVTCVVVPYVTPGRETHDAHDAHEADAHNAQDVLADAHRLLDGHSDL